MCDLDILFANNRAWSARRVAQDPEFFRRLSSLQSPRYLWIGCSDSRVPANEIIGLDPGEVFVHRNVANLVVHSDLNCLSVLQYAVDALKVEHIMVVGHYGCGGVQAVAEGRSIGIADSWLRHIEDIAIKHRDVLARLSGAADRGVRLVELNTIEQVANVCRTTCVRQAWDRGQPVEVHGLVYGLADGLLRRIGGSAGNGRNWMESYLASLQALA